MKASNSSDLKADDPADIRGWLRLSDRITTSGRLLEADPARLAALGVRHVVNLSLHEHPEALPDAAAHMAESGLRYTHIPVPFDAPGEDHYAAFRAAIEADDAPVHVHCIMNFRVSAFFYRWHCETRGMAEPEARALMARIWSPETDEQPAAPTWAAFIADKKTGESE